MTALHRRQLLQGFVALPLLPTLSLPTAAVAAAVEAGKVSRIKGEASLERGGKTMPLELGTVVHVSDRLSTAKDARLEITLADDTKVTLGANAGLVIDEFVFQPDKGKGTALLNVVKGAFRFTTGKISGLKDKDVGVKTAFANLAVRGTDFWGGPIDESNGVLVLDGEVRVSTRKGKVVLGKGQGTMVASRRKKPGEIKSWPEAKVQRAVATISFD